MTQESNHSDSAFRHGGQFDIWKRQEAGQIRVAEPLVDEIGDCIRKLKAPISRNTWLLEAAVEKLHRMQEGEPRNGSK